MSPTYLVPYPYTITIFMLLMLGAMGLLIFWERIDWYKYLHSIIFSSILGVAEIHNLENDGNVPSWYFPEGAALLGVAWGNVYWEDILFVPACFTIFYLFMWSIRNVDDFIPKSTYSYFILFAVIVEALIFQVSGKGIENLMIGYTLIPLLVFVLYIVVTKRKVNATHAILTLIFVVVFSSVWELVNVWIQTWVYNTHCDLMGDRGWILNGKLHVGIFLQYPYTGFVIVYGSRIFFDKKTQPAEVS